MLPDHRYHCCASCWHCCDPDIITVAAVTTAIATTKQSPLHVDTAVVILTRPTAAITTTNAITATTTTAATATATALLQ
jgi:hypothetical protein